MTDAGKPQKDYYVISIYVANSLKFIERHRLTFSLFTGRFSLIMTKNTVFRLSRA